MRLQIEKSPDRIDITWPLVLIPTGVYTAIRDAALRSTDYSILEGKKLAEFSKFLRAVQSEHQAPIETEAAISIRNAVLKDKVIRGYGRMNQLIRRISTEYARTGVVELALKYDFPPLNLLRGILLHRGFDSGSVYSVFAGRESPESLLSGRNLAQYRLAVEYDAESSFNQAEVTRRAAEAEAAVVRYFNTIGVKMKTQDELVAEQMAEHGRAVATPDILFCEPVYVNGERVYWLDYKDYVATEVPFIFKSNVDQASRYVARWGPGVLCYGHGVVEGVVVPGAQCMTWFD